MKNTTADWSDLPIIDWPPDVPRPSMEDVLAAAEHVTATNSATSGPCSALYAVAVVPWLVRQLGFSGAQACRIAGLGRHLARADLIYRVIVSPAGQAVAHRMTRHLREQHRAKME